MSLGFILIACGSDDTSDVDESEPGTAEIDEEVEEEDTTPEEEPEPEIEEEENDVSELTEEAVRYQIRLVFEDRSYIRFGEDPTTVFIVPTEEEFQDIVSRLAFEDEDVANGLIGGMMLVSENIMDTYDVENFIIVLMSGEVESAEIVAIVEDGLPTHSEFH